MDAVRKQLITTRESSRWPGLFVKKYTKRVFYDNLWHENPDLLESRGHVVNAKGEIVIRPFTKIFNRFENNTDIALDERCVAVRKVNGFMACATWVEDVQDVVVSTTGSLDSDYVAIAERHITQDMKDYIRESDLSGTLMFEIVDKEDPHIVPEGEGAWLIGYRQRKDERPYHSSPRHEEFLDNLAFSMGALRPRWVVTEFSRIVDAAKNAKHEGWVVYGLESGTALKIKSPYYLALKAIARRKDITKLNKQFVDEEFYGLIDHLTSIGESFTMLSEQERLDYIRNYYEQDLVHER